jgi:hypothetical protein
VALIFMDGFDKYGGLNTNSAGVIALLTAGEWTSTAGGGQQIAASLSTTGQALLVGAAGVATRTIAAVGRIIGGMRFSSSLASTAGIQFLDAAANQAGICINVAGTIAVRNGVYNSGTILGTSTASITASTTHYLEWDITFGNSANYQLWLDGVSILSGTGDTTATVNNTISGFSLSNAAAATYIVDDLYLFDATGTTNNAVLLTSPRIETQFPTSDGAVQFAVGAGILGSNAARVVTTTAPAAASLVLRRFTSVVAATLNSVTIMPGATSAGANYRGVVYTDSAGAAGTLMSSGTQVTGVTSGTAATLPLTTPQSLSAGTSYWLGFINDTSVALQQTDGNLSGYRAANTYASGAPGTAPAMTSGQATYLLWGNLTGITGNNWYEVSQNPTDGSPSYVFDATVGHEDLYSFPALSAPPSAIYAVAVKASLSKSDAGAKTASVRLKSGATDSAGTGGTALAPGTSYGWMTSHYPTDPNTSAAWTLGGLNSAQCGVKVES